MNHLPFTKYNLLFVLLVHCALLFGIAAAEHRVSSADDLKPLRQMTAESERNSSAKTNPDDFSLSLSDALNRPLNGPSKSGSPPLVRTPPPIPFPAVVRGQSSPSGTDVLSERPPHPQGTVNAEALDPKLLDDRLIGDVLSAENELTAVKEPAVVSPGTEDKEFNDAESKQKQWANAALLVITIITVMMLVYAVVIAYDYRQRWVQALIMQNSRLGAEDELRITNYELPQA